MGLSNINLISVVGLTHFLFKYSKIFQRKVIRCVFTNKCCFCLQIKTVTIEGLTAIRYVNYSFSDRAEF